MRLRVLLSLLFSLIMIVVPQAQRAETDVAQLPVRRVVLYKTGVGYFEHLGSVTGTSDVTIQFTSAQLNDVLKSLTALDLDSGRISNINYNSIASVEQRLGALRLPLGAQADPMQLYNALRGARIDVRSGTAVATGRLLGVERRQRAKGAGGATESVDELTLVTDDGSIRTMILGADVSVHVGERDLRDEISRYLAVVASGRDQDVRRMVISTSGNGTRRIFISYISEVPIWKSTYRLVLPSQAGAQPLLQGWAIVDNTVGEDWTNVELSLVAGAPQSFIQEVSQPYYARRPVVPRPEAILLAPQTHAPTLQASQGSVSGAVRDASGAALPGARVSILDNYDRTVAEGTTEADGQYRLDAPPGSYSLRMQLAGFAPFERVVTIRAGSNQRVDAMLTVAAAQEAVTVTAEARTTDYVSRRPGGIAGGTVGGLPEPPASPPPPPAATSQELGDLFEYRLTQPVTVRKNQSALVPILNADVRAERVSLWNRGATSGRPLRAVWMTNATNLTLDGGTFSVMDGNAFAGEGIVESFKPGERRLVSYATDLGVLVDGKLDESSGRFTRLTARDGVIIAAEEERARWNYRVRNEDTTPRTLIIEHPVRTAWSTGTEPAPAESTATSARYRVPVEAKKEAVLTVTERHAGDTRYSVGDVNESLLAMFVQRGLPEERVRRAFQPVMDKRQEIAAVDARIAVLNGQINTIAQDQQRVRENMKALRNTDEEKALVQRYTRQLSAQEDQLESLQSDVRKATADGAQKRSELARLIQQLTFEIGG